MGYNTLDLRFARNDAVMLRDALEHVGFSVVVTESSGDATLTKLLLIESLDNFLDSCGSSDSVLMYFSGHAFTPKNELLLLIGSDLNRMNASSVRLSYITSALENCGARHKLLILDCCHALAEIANWRPPQSDRYRILAASGRLERAKEIDEINASFLTYQIARALTSDLQHAKGGHPQLTVNSLFSWLTNQTSVYNSRRGDTVPYPKLMGDQGADFFLTEPVSTVSLALTRYMDRLSRCLSSCTADLCSSRYQWCRPVTEVGSIVAQYVIPRIKYASPDDGMLLEIRLDTFLWRWIADQSQLHLAILGDSGIGKSSACVYISSALAAQATGASIPNLIPIYLSFDSIARRSLLGADIATVLRSASHIDASDEDIAYLVRSRRLLFILDGFDEIADRADYSKIVRNLHQLSPILNSGCRVILTCRTHFFVNQEQLEQVLTGKSGYGTELYTAFARQNPAFSISELQEFGEGEIREVVQRSGVANVADVLTRIKSLYNLEDLARRPLLLQLILRTLPALLQSEVRINRATLYGAYVDFWINREMGRVESLVDVSEKVRFIERLAVEMWESGASSLAYADLQERVRNEYSHDILALPDFYSKDYDTRIASFLNRDGSGSYKFMHRSFMEYFAARFLARKLSTTEDVLEHWDARWFDREIARFVGEILDHPSEESSVRKLMDYCLEARDRTFLWNALHVFSLLDEKYLKLTFRNDFLPSLIDRASEETRAVMLRQYCRVVARLGDRGSAEDLIDRILAIVSSSLEQNKDNNDTYVNYYYGQNSACAALLTHLATPDPKYDRKLHIYVLGQLGEVIHSRHLNALTQTWRNPVHLEMARESERQILDRASRPPAY